MSHFHQTSFFFKLIFAKFLTFHLLIFSLGSAFVPSAKKVCCDENPCRTCLCENSLHSHSIVQRASSDLGERRYELHTCRQGVIFSLATDLHASPVPRDGKFILPVSKKIAERSRYSAELLRNIKNFKVCKVTRLI